MRTSRRNPDCKRASYWGRGGAGVMFTCSEDDTVLLLLRAEWVEQGGTWGIPGGGIGEGFFRTPMQPITDLDVFRRKAQQEAEEECGALPPYMTSLPEGLPYTQYEDCGFRYTTFILDITKAQKDTWAPYSADGENDAFVWFPLDEVKAGRPLPDEYGDLHDIHFGVKFTMDNLPARTHAVAATPVNPLFPEGTLIAYHGGHALVGGKFDLSYVGQGEGASFPGIFFTNSKGNAEGYAKHAPLGENYVYTVRLDARGFYRPASGQPQHLRDRLVQLVKDVGADKLPREGDSNRYGYGYIGNVIQKLGPVEGPKALVRIGVTGQVRYWAEDLFEVAVLDPSVITLLNTEKVAVPYSHAGSRKTSMHTFPYDPLFDKGPAPLPQILDFLRFASENIDEQGFRVPQQARISPEAFVAWAETVEVPPGKREEDFPENLRLLDESEAAWDQGDWERSGALREAYAANKLREGIYDQEYVKRTINNYADLMKNLIRSGAPRELPKFRNPLRFETRYTAQEAAELRRTRAGRSVASLALQGKVVERMANTPHNFVVALKGSVKKPVPRAPDAVTLVLDLDLEDFNGGSDERTMAGIYTAFTYLHKLGDTVRLAPLDYTDRGARRSPALTPLYNMIKAHLRLLEGDARDNYRTGIRRCVNSQMVREGYSADWRQAFSDLFPLCELTPPSRPLLLPILTPYLAGSAKNAKVFNDVIVPDFNKKFREFYDAYIPTLYGKRIDL